MSDELKQTMTTLAAITASLVKTFDGRDPGFQKSFLINLESTFRVVHESCPEQKQARDTLARVKDILEIMQ